MLPKRGSRTSTPAARIFSQQNKMAANPSTDRYLATRRVQCLCQILPTTTRQMLVVSSAIASENSSGGRQLWAECSRNVLIRCLHFDALFTVIAVVTETAACFQEYPTFKTSRRKCKMGVHTMYTRCNIN